MSENDVSSHVIGKMKKLGVLHKSDLPLYLPFRYDDFRKPITVISDALESEDKLCFKLTLNKNPDIEFPSSGPSRVRLEFIDENNVTINSMVFGAVQSWKTYRKGNLVSFTAKTSIFNGEDQLKGVVLIPEHEQNKIVPRYRGRPKVVSTVAISQEIKKSLILYMYEAIAHIEKIMDMTEKEICSQAHLPFHCLSDLINTLHYPKDMSDLDNAVRSVRLIHALQALTLIEKSEPKRISDQASIYYSLDKLKKMVNSLPFKLTNDQKKSIWEIILDMEKPLPMDRLLSGDVGCGKTLSYGIPAVSAHLTGKKTVIMMPNSLLASQVAQELSDFFPEASISLLIGANKKDQKNILENDLIVGTTAILWWVKSRPEYKIDLLIIDEQQKLGIEQKNQLISQNTNFLEATATAIPQTMASVIYGNKPISKIEKLPVVKNIKSKIIDKKKHHKTYLEMVKTIEAGHQISILYPKRAHTPVEHYRFMIPEEMDMKKLKTELRDLGVKHIKKMQEFDALPEFNYWQCQYPTSSEVDFLDVNISLQQEYNLKAMELFIPENEKDPALKAVEAAFHNWNDKFPGRVVMIHGKLSEKDKQEAIRKAKAAEVDIIITTTVIEIGLTMPNLKSLLVVNSEKYGTSTLHQLRGRVSRHGGDGNFYMLIDENYDDANPDSIARLELLEKHTKGSVLANEDMKLRGFGDLKKNGFSQAGNFDGVFPKIKMIPSDVELLIKKRKENLNHTENLGMN